MGKDEKSNDKQEKSKCAAKNRKGGSCGHPAGYQTDHPGIGRCKFHGGASPIKHGRYSKIPRPRLQKWLEDIEANEANPLDLIPDIHLLRAMLHEAANQKQFKLEMAAEILERISRVAQRFHDMQQQKTVSIETLQWIKSQMGLVVAGCVKDAETLRNIESGWSNIMVKS